LATLWRCIDEVAKRPVVSPGKYKIKVVDKDGTREVEFSNVMPSFLSVFLALNSLLLSV
ncbi:hypothetical protein C8J55DRAFT_430046, partial [Lentinula edodes]